MKTPESPLNYLQWQTNSKSHNQWPWTTPNSYFKVTPIFDAVYVVNGTR